MLAHELTHVMQQSGTGNFQLNIQRQTRKTTSTKRKKTASTKRIIKIYLDGHQRVVVMQGNKTLFNKTASGAKKTRRLLKTKSRKCQGNWCYALYRIGYKTPGKTLTSRQGLRYFLGVYRNYGIHSNIQRKPIRVRTKKGKIKIIRRKKILRANGTEDPKGQGCVRLSEVDARQLHNIVRVGDEVRYYYKKPKTRGKRLKARRKKSK